MFARTASALKTTALRSGASAFANVGLPAPGKPMMRILTIHMPLSLAGRPSGDDFPARNSARNSLLVKGLRRDFCEGRKQIVDDTTALGLDFRSHRHAASERYDHSLDLHCAFLQRYSCWKHEVLQLPWNA